MVQQVSTKFDMRQDMGVLRNYGRMLVELSKVVPDGIVCFFVSYQYMDSIITKWNNLGLLKELTQQKLVFIETQVSSVIEYLIQCFCGWRPCCKPVQNHVNRVQCHPSEGGERKNKWCTTLHSVFIAP